MAHTPVTFAALLDTERTKQLDGDFDDNLRVLKNIGARFAGRTLYMWGGETRLESLLLHGKEATAKIHAELPGLILQAAVFEIVSDRVDRLPIPGWVFEAFDLPIERRNFRYEAMLYSDGHGRGHWSKNASVPDMSQIETRLWFYYLVRCYIDIGIEAIHFGQVEIMDDNDPEHDHWFDMLSRIRRYAVKRARRGLVLCDAHTPSGGTVRNDRLLFDFHSFPLRVEEALETPEQGILRMGHYDSLYGHSRGGLTPSGWQCERLPYLVEFDNFGGSGKEGQIVGDHWIWGYDEIVWFAKQSEAYRNLWLHYAWNWLRLHDPNGYLQMPCSRVLYRPVDGKRWYYANTPSTKVPGGFNQEETIKRIWAEQDRMPH